MPCNNLPILIAQKPTETNNQIDNILKHGTGVYAIDKTRIKHGKQPGIRSTGGFNSGGKSNCYGVSQGVKNTNYDKGRFPTNTIIDNKTSHILDDQSGDIRSSNIESKTDKKYRNKEIFNNAFQGQSSTFYKDTGGASRFFKQCNYSELDFSDDFLYMKKEGVKTMKLINDDCLNWLKKQKDNSVHLFLTDPPYELSNRIRDNRMCLDCGCKSQGTFIKQGHVYSCPKCKSENIGWERAERKKGFMGKTWDVLPTKEILTEIHRVLKPGGFLVAFSSPRTYHKLAYQSEEVGFSIHPFISWIYGCLTPDTELLINGKWQKFNKSIENKNTLCYNKDINKFTWEKIEQVYEYEYNDTIYNIKSDFTDQLVTKNHRCIVEQNGRKIFKYAEELETKENISFLESVSELQKTFYSNECKGILAKIILFKQMWSKNTINKTIKQQNKKSDVIQKQFRTQKIRKTIAEIIPQHYQGKVWCVKVPTGIFVARRNGKIFITGNSGFPKAVDVSKLIDRKLGKEREVIGKYKRPDGTDRKYEKWSEKRTELDFRSQISEKEIRSITKPSSDLAKLWSGYKFGGQALKPSNEPIGIFQKPTETNNQIDNILKHGTGAYNIDETRIEYEDTPDPATNPKYRIEKGYKTKHGKNPISDCPMKEDGQDKLTKGRFPTNTIIDNKTSHILDSQSGELKSGDCKSEYITKESENTAMSGKNYKRPMINRDGDTGGASRFFKKCNYSKGDFESFFYCSKASVTERNLGCDELPDKQIKEEGGARTYNDRCKNCGKKFVGEVNICECEVHLTAKELDIYEDTYKLKDNTPENIKKEIQKILENNE